LITRNTDYAIRALLCLTGYSGRFVSTTEIAKTEKIPLYFLRRIVQALIKHKIVIGREGVRGGIALHQSAGHITVGNIIKIFQDDITFLDCVIKKRICPEKYRCPLRRRIEHIETQVVSQLKRITIDDLVKERDK
jgi:Rrf2 family protein